MDNNEQDLIANIVAATVKQLVREQVIPSRKDNQKQSRNDPRSDVITDADYAMELFSKAGDKNKR